MVYPAGYRCRCAVLRWNTRDNCKDCAGTGIVAISWHELDGKPPEWRIEDRSPRKTGSTGAR